MSKKPAVLVTVSASGQVSVTAHESLKEATREGEAWQRTNGDNPNWMAVESAS